MSFITVILPVYIYFHCDGPWKHNGGYVMFTRDHHVLPGRAEPFSFGIYGSAPQLAGRPLGRGGAGAGCLVRAVKQSGAARWAVAEPGTPHVGPNGRWIRLGPLGWIRWVYVTVRWSYRSSVAS